MRPVLLRLMTFGTFAALWLGGAGSACADFLSFELERREGLVEIASSSAGDPSPAGEQTPPRQPQFEDVPDAALAGGPGMSPTDNGGSSGGSQFAVLDELQDIDVSVVLRLLVRSSRPPANPFIGKLFRPS